MNKKNKDTFNRSDIEKSLREEFPNLTKIQISDSIDTILDSITEAVALNKGAEIRGFGTFLKKYIRPRKFSNPKTKKVSYLGETTTINFKSSKLLNKK